MVATGARVLIARRPRTAKLPSFGGIRAAALAKALPPSQGGDETAYLTAFLNARRSVMAAAQHDTDRVDSVQAAFLRAGNLTLATPLRWTIHGDSYTIAR